MWLRSALTSACLILVSCSESAAPTDAVQTFVGTIPGTDMVVGAASHEGRMSLYVCGGDSTFATHSRWYDGPIDAATGDVDLSVNNWIVTANVDGASLVGTLIAPDLSELPFSAALAADGVPGVYDAEPNGCRIGVVAR